MTRKTTRALDCGCEYSNFSFAEAQTATQNLCRETKNRLVEKLPTQSGVKPPKGKEFFLYLGWNIGLDIGHTYPVVLVAEKGGD